jgi:hypothetical protein
MQQSLPPAPRGIRGQEIRMSNAHTYEQIANDWHLWQEYVDQHATMTRDEFDGLTIEQKISIQVEAFGPEATVTINGRTIAFDAAVNLMDDEIRERLHSELAPCSNQEFMDAYVVAHAEKFDGEEFAVN